MAQVVITEFVGDTSGLDEAIADGAKGIDGMQASAVNATKATDAMGASVGNASGRFAAMSAAAKKAIGDVGSAAKATGDATTKSAGLFGSMVSGIKNGFASAGKGVSSFTAGVKNGFAGVGKGVSSLTVGIKDGFKDAAQSAASSLGGFGTKAVAALGPVGIAVAVVGGTLAKVFANTDAGATYFDGLRRAGSIAFDKLTGVVMSFFDTASDRTTTLGKVFGTLGDIIGALTAPVRMLASAIGDLTGISDALAEANAQGQLLAQMYDDLDEAQRNNIVSNAELDKQVSALNIKLRDRTLSDRERLKIADEIAAKEKQRSNAELTVLRQSTAAVEKEIEFSRVKGEVSDELARKLADAKAAEIRAEQASMEVTERAAVRANQIREQSAAAAEAARAKRKAAEEKAAAQEIKRAQDVVNAKAAIEARVAEINTQAAQAGMTDQQKAEAEVEARYAKELQATLEAFAALRKLQEGNASEVEALDRQSAEVALQIEANKNAELAKMREDAAMTQAKSAEDVLAKIREATQSEADNRRDAINEQFNAMRGAAEKNITNAEDLSDALIDIEKARSAKLAEIKDEADVAAAEKEKAAQEQRIAIISGASQSLNALLEQMAAGQIGTAEEAGKALVGITIDTVGAIVQAKIVEMIAKSAAFGAEAGPVGAAVGLAAGTALGAILKGLLNALKGQIAGNYDGDPYVSGTPMWSGRDGHLRRLHTGERVVTAKDNADHWDMLEAMRKNRIGEWVASQQTPWADALALNFAPRVNAYMERGGTATLTLPRGHDKGVIKATAALAKEQRRTNDVLIALAGARPRTANRRLR